MAIDMDLRDQSAYRPASSKPTNAPAAGFAPVAPGFYVQRALAFVQQQGRSLGLEPAQVPEFQADPTVQKTSSGAAAVHLQQQYKSIPIFQASQSVRFSPDNNIQDSAGRIVQISTDLATMVGITVEQAVAKAAAFVARPPFAGEKQVDDFGNPISSDPVNLIGFVPKRIASFLDSPEQQTVLEQGPFGDEIKASLVWVPVSTGLVLAWEIEMVIPGGNGQYRIIVNAGSGEILYSKQLLKAVAARGSIYKSTPDLPKQMTTWPLPLATYNLPGIDGLPQEFPYDWVELDSTVGNNTFAHSEDSGPPVSGPVQNGEPTFDPQDPFGADQRVVNMFYFASFMHDLTYLLGFREADGNFQKNMFGRGGAGNDPLDARAYAGPVFMTASMSYPPDGISPVMKMGLNQNTNRHTALDATVVFHEYMHGVTNRLVGGRINDHSLEAPQSAGMGEGWGDFFACTLVGTTVVGAWVANSARGIRGFPYDSNFPDNFANLGTGRYVEQHMIGEIWCATLMELSRTVGTRLTMQLVIDALKLSPQNPSFLDMRDAILAALKHKQQANQLNAQDYSAATSGFWKVFSHFGMGPNARCDGANLTGIVADLAVPNTPAPSPAPASGPTSPASGSTIVVNLPIPDKNPVGVSSSVPVIPPGTITRISVGVSIAHPFIGDLQVSLTSPGGNLAMLHDQTGFNTADLRCVFTSDETSSLTALIGARAEGTWTLKVADLARLNVGVFESWSLRCETR